MMLSSQLFLGKSDSEEFFYFLDVLENSLTDCNLGGCANFELEIHAKTV